MLKYILMANSLNCMHHLLGPTEGKILIIWFKPVCEKSEYCNDTVLKKIIVLKSNPRQWFGFSGFLAGLRIRIRIPIRVKEVDPDPDPDGLGRSQWRRRD